VSQDGLTWTRGGGAVEGVRGEDKESDVGSMLHPNADWWTFDTAHLGVSDVQVGVGAWCTHTLPIRLLFITSQSTYRT
jgi:hypothetical protein